MKEQGGDVRSHQLLPESRSAEIYPTRSFRGARRRDRSWPKAAGPLRKGAAGKADGLLRPNLAASIAVGTPSKQPFVCRPATSAWGREP